MDLTTATISTVREVFLFTQCVAADRTHLFCLKRSRWHNFSIFCRCFGPILAWRSSASDPNACIADYATATSRVSVTHDVCRSCIDLSFTIAPTLFLSQLSHSTPILFLNATVLRIVIVGSAITEHLFFSFLKYCLQLCVCKGQLPQERISLTNSKDLHERVDGVDTML